MNERWRKLEQYAADLKESGIRVQVARTYERDHVNIIVSNDRIFLTGSIDVREFESDGYAVALARIIYDLAEQIKKKEKEHAED